ncbi:putative olfactory receptor 14L1 [Trichechus manatus latirostris]|uniref:Olfactory receptor 14L1 n=1 Tax=Trichechus manatus latirostris TaxID=127582 RepID=A0A2Y9G108_TRIMA|nr:putative olfactory receptor 14L1 [Trichechus manatus latirostris]
MVLYRELSVAFRCWQTGHSAVAVGKLVLIALGEDAKLEMINHRAVTEFLLLGSSTDPGTQNLHGTLFLTVYLAALTGNGLIIFLITCDLRFHTPMYFLLKNLSFIDFGYISVTVPKFVLNSLMHRSSISFLGCVLQVFFFVVFACAELAILTVMSYDLYVAICCPLHYEVIMNTGACGQMVVASYISGVVSGAMHTAATFSITFSSNRIHQFFCDIPQIILIADSQLNIGELGITALIFSASLVCFVFIVYSYVHIFSIIQKASSEGRNKALSTCIPLLVGVILFILTASLDYLKPPSNVRSVLDLILSVFYTVLPPTLNPIIYSLRNKEMNAALGKVLGMEVFKSN